MNENKIPDPEQIKKEVDSGTFTTFRTLLRQGIGTRTQAAFAEQTGLSRSTVSKMLNQTVIPRPEKKTLEAFASQMFSVSYTDLCLSCGYEPEDVNMIATQVRQAILDGAGALKGALAGSLREFLKQIETLYLPPIKTGWRGWGENDEGLPDVPGEEKKVYSCEWDYDDNHGSTFFVLGYSETKKDQLVLNGIRTDATCIPPSFLKYVDGEKVKCNAALACIIAKRKPAGTESVEEKLLRNIFGGGEEYIRTEIGWGFYYPETPAGFDNYLLEHAASFCTDDNTRKFYQEWLGSGKNADEAFEGYMGESTEDGTGAVVAHILSVETGKPFRFTRKYTENGPDDSCVFCTEGVSQTDRRMKIDKKLLKDLYAAANELGIERFGQVYHREVETCLEDQLYNTKYYHYEFVAKK